MNRKKYFLAFNFDSQAPYDATADKEITDLHNRFLIIGDAAYNACVKLLTMHCIN